MACALLLYGAKLENFSGLRDVLIEMGIYFQAQACHFFYGILRLVLVYISLDSYPTLYFPG